MAGLDQSFSSFDYSRVPHFNKLKLLKKKKLFTAIGKMGNYIIVKVY